MNEKVSMTQMHKTFEVTGPLLDWPVQLGLFDHYFVLPMKCFHCNMTICI